MRQGLLRAAVVVALVAAPVALAAAATPASPTRVLTAGSVGDGVISTADGRIRCEPTCSASFRRGRIVTLTAMPRPNFIFRRWIAGCVGTAPACSVAMDAATTVRAEFTRIAQEVRITVGGPGRVVSEPPGIDCGAPEAQACAGEFGRGQQIRLVPVVPAGRVFAGWRGACEGAPAEGCDLTVAPDNEIRATFRRAAAATGPQRLTVEGGLITSAPAGIVCPSDCTAAFPANTPVTLGGGQFWSGDCIGRARACTVIPDGETRAVSSLLAFTDTDEVGVTVSVSGRGRVTAGREIRCIRPSGTSLDCRALLRRGGKILLRASPRSRFRGWGQFCQGRKPTCRLTLRTAKTVTAAFAR